MKTNTNALLDEILPPPRGAGERAFNDDLRMLDDDELRDEQRRLKLRLLLTPRVERERADQRWFLDRLQRIDARLRGAGVRR